MVRPSEIVMDHLAVASDHAWDNVIRYAYHLGGRWMGGPDNDPTFEMEDRFYFCQVEFAHGTKIEILEAIPGPGSDFIRRFLYRNGPGPHHYTFKVPDIDEAMDAVSGAGYDLVGVSRDDPEWQEAFLHPKQSHGIVIQLSCPGEGEDRWIDPTPLPPSPRPEPAALERCHHLVADVAAAAKLFGGVLNMTETRRGTDDTGEWAELTSGPWTLRLIQPTDPVLGHWLGDRAGRLHHIEVAIGEPGTVHGARPLGDGRYEIPPESNLGLRLVLREP